MVYDVGRLDKDEITNGHDWQWNLVLEWIFGAIIQATKAQLEHAHAVNVMFLLLMDNVLNRRFNTLLAMCKDAKTKY